MSDDIDIANEQAEKWLQGHIRASRGIPLVVQGDGVCLWCSEVVLEENGIVGRWCGNECRDCYDKRKRY